jgi:glyoxylase-like metal-dependent hydrolase (beta-lactamase superfamily II)
MYALQSLDERTTLLTLPSGARWGLPWDVPTNVTVFGGRVPTLIDTGAPGSHDGLVAALATVGLAPSEIRRVVLTGVTRANLGNVALFPNAVVYAVDTPATRQPAAHLRDEARLVGALARRLLAIDGAPATWTLDTIASFEEEWATGTPESLDPFPLEEGLDVAAGDGQIRTLVTPGNVPAGACFFRESTRDLFAGRMFDPTDEHAPLQAADYAEQLMRVSQLPAARVISQVGPPDPYPHVLFRATNLSVTNLLSNLQFVLTGTRGVEEVTWRDRGYRPRSVLRYAAWVLRNQRYLDELTRAGIASRSDDAVLPAYTIDIPARLS